MLAALLTGAIVASPEPSPAVWDDVHARLDTWSAERTLPLVHPKTRARPAAPTASIP